MVPHPIDITRRYLEERQLTLQAFADGLGINASRQMVFMWKEGKQAPSLETLFKVSQSKTAADWAKQWAGECIAAIAGVRTVVNLEKLEEGGD